jgi:hypothetical protein
MKTGKGIQKKDKVISVSTRKWNGAKILIN